MAKFYYNSLPHIQEASKALNDLDDDYLSLIDQILIKYDLQSSLGITLVHRHFLLEDDEQLIELKCSQSDDVVSSVFKNGVPDDQVLSGYNLLIPQYPTIVPSVFIVRQSGVIPYEYCCVEKEEANKLHFDILDRIDDEFCAEWVTTLERLRMVDKLGLAIIDESTNGRVEDIYPNQRVSVYREYRVGERRDEGVSTLWTVAGDPKRSCNRCS
jgi:hypothetical protein